MGNAEEECGPAALPRALAPPPFAVAVYTLNLYNPVLMERSAVKFIMLSRRAVW